MSFSKAKIQRFNDIKDCTPSPAKYNVQTQEKIKLGIISQPGKCLNKTGSCGGSETGSVHSTPIFQTPTVPKKKKFLGLMSTSKTKANDQHEELREKIVECNNKDMYIKDLIEQLEELREKITSLEKEKSKLVEDNGQLTAETTLLKRKQSEVNLKYSTLYKQIKEVKNEFCSFRTDSINQKNENCYAFEQLVNYINKFQSFYNIHTKEIEDAFSKKEEVWREEYERELKEMRRQLDEAHTQLSQSQAKIMQLEENFKEINVLTEIQTKEKIEEVETIWKNKLEEKEKEYEAILKECQEISEYNIIESEVEKNLFKNQLEEQKVIYDEILEKCNILEAKYNKLNEDRNNLQNEKHAYEVSISTFRDTIEVLKKRLIDSDRDVEQLKEELGKCEEKILVYEKKVADLTDKLSEAEVANEELEMQYESTSKIMQDEVKTVEKSLLEKVQIIKNEMKQALKDKELLNQVRGQQHEQQLLLKKVQETITDSTLLIEKEEQENERLKSELEEALKKLGQETEEAAEIRKKYIEKSGQFDVLSQQLEDVINELKTTKERNEELQNLIGPYQEQLEAYDNELKVMLKEKQIVENEAKELTQKYAEILGHHNQKQKIRHLNDLKVKSSELFEKNMDLEAKNYKLNKLVEKLKKEVEDLRKCGKKLMKVGSEDKENMGSPKCVKNVQSPGPLKEKN